MVTVDYKSISYTYGLLVGGEFTVPNIKSAIKRVELARKRTLRNAPVKSALRTSIRKCREAIAAGQVDDAKVVLTGTLRTIDKAVSKGILHKNAAARRKSRLTKRYNELASQAQ